MANKITIAIITTYFIVVMNKFCFFSEGCLIISFSAGSTTFFVGFIVGLFVCSLSSGSGFLRDVKICFS